MTPEKNPPQHATTISSIPPKHAISFTLAALFFMMGVSDKMLTHTQSHKGPSPFDVMSVLCLLKGLHDLHQEKRLTVAKLKHGVVTLYNKLTSKHNEQQAASTIQHKASSQQHKPS